MRAVIFGNGLNIKFGGKDYFNGKIIRRGFSSLQQNKKVYEMVPVETVQLLKVMYKTVPDIIAGLYDDIDNTLTNELAHFKKSYDSSKITDIGSVGMEDYFLVLHLIYQNKRIHNQGTITESTFSIEKEKEAMECFRDLCLMGIYNNGKINQLYQRYSNQFSDFVNRFDLVFTTNYDSNLDTIYQGTVQHIHGQFDVLDQLYNPNSFRNSLSDDQFNRNKLVNLEKYRYLHSTALMNYSGQQKFEQLTLKKELNELTVKDIMKVPDSMVDSEAKQLAIEAKKKQVNDSSLMFQYSEALEAYLDFTGELSIIGLSASNDNHIFTDHNQVKYTYYYFSEEDLILAQKILPESAKFKAVQDLWEELKK